LGYNDKRKEGFLMMNQSYQGTRMRLSIRRLYRGAIISYLKQANRQDREEISFHYEEEISGFLLLEVPLDLDSFDFSYLIHTFIGDFLTKIYTGNFLTTFHDIRKESYYTDNISISIGISRRLMSHR
jgi:hypothetical protein